MAELARDWAGAALARARRGDPAALVTVLATEGSAPREAGVKMAVWDDGQAGTIGGGNLEFLASGQARAMLAAGAGFAIQDYPLGPLLQQCCGGRVRLLIERVGGRDAPWLTVALGRLDARKAFDLGTRFENSCLIKTVSAAANDSEASPVRAAKRVSSVSRGASSHTPWKAMPASCASAPAAARSSGRRNTASRTTERPATSAKRASSIIRP